jgi:hypothetical protein
MTSSMHGIPEPLHLYAQMKPDAEGQMQVVRSSGEMVVPLTNSADFVKDTIAALKMLGVDHAAQIIIQGVSGNPAFNGALKHHGA